MIRMHGEYRRHLRSGIRVPVVLKYANHTIETTTLDVSASGLRLKRPDGMYIRPGEVTDVDFPDKASMNASATVAYTGKSHIGLQFYRRRFSENELSELYAVAPSWQRVTARSKRALWMNSRRFAGFLANTYLRAPIHALARPHFVFAVYGNKEQAKSYSTPRMAERMPSNVVLGFIRNADMRGLLVASQFREDELEEDSEKVRLYLDQLQRDYPDVQRIALVGRTAPQLRHESRYRDYRTAGGREPGNTIYDLGRGAENAGASPILPANQHCRAGRRRAHRQCGMSGSHQFV